MKTKYHDWYQNSWSAKLIINDFFRKRLLNVKSCKNLASWIQILQESCKKDSNLARILQDACKKYAFPCKIACKIINSSITRVTKKLKICSKMTKMNQIFYNKIVCRHQIISACKLSFIPHRFKLRLKLFYNCSSTDENNWSLKLK